MTADAVWAGLQIYYARREIMERTIKIGVSACLLGQKVRYNGGHSRARYLTDTLGQWFDYVPVCPEVECGMSIPRETLRLVGDPDNPRLVTSKTGVDHTRQMKQWARKRLDDLAAEELCGFVFKSRSPSSGMERVKVYTPEGSPTGQKSVGIFARAFMDRFPRIPVEEDGRLNDPILRENFIESVFVMKAWRETLARRKSMGSLVDFHTRHKLLIMAHGQTQYRQMGKLVAGGKAMPPTELYDQYETLLFEALRLKATVKKNANVLMHMLGYFKKQLTADEKAELLEILEAYRRGDFPLIVPMTLVNHYVRKYDQPYLKDQVYLNPHPLSLRLRNHA
jgi:uncharacterized protein YbgA (DUF1722 family)/uncharacterized protein YbbK (DUF523 family)